MYFSVLQFYCSNSLRLATVNALRPVRKSHEFKFSQYTETDITVDPLIVLRCDERVYRYIVGF